MVEIRPLKDGAMFRNSDAQRVSVSVAVLLTVLGSVTPFGEVTVAVFEIEPVADALMVPVALYVTLLAAGILTVSLMLPLPLAEKPVAPPVSVAVNVTPVKVAANMS